MPKLSDLRPKKEVIPEDNYVSQYIRHLETRIRHLETRIRNLETRNKELNQELQKSNIKIKTLRESLVKNPRYVISGAKELLNQINFNQELTTSQIYNILKSSFTITYSKKSLERRLFFLLEKGFITNNKNGKLNYWTIVKKNNSTNILIEKEPILYIKLKELIYQQLDNNPKLSKKEIYDYFFPRFEMSKTTIYKIYYEWIEDQNKIFNYKLKEVDIKNE